jgi:hypothetical protein
MTRRKTFVDAEKASARLCEEAKHAGQLSDYVQRSLGAVPAMGVDGMPVLPPVPIHRVRLLSLRL